MKCCCEKQACTTDTATTCTCVHYTLVVQQRLTTHEENQVNLAEDMLDCLQGGSRVQHNPSLYPQILDLHMVPGMVTARCQCVLFFCFPCAQALWWITLLWMHCIQGDRPILRDAVQALYRSTGFPVYPKHDMSHTKSKLCTA